MRYSETSRKMTTYYFPDILPLDSMVPWCVKSSHHFRFSWFHDKDFDAPLVPIRPADTSGDDSDDGLAQQYNSLSPANMTNAARWISCTWKVFDPPHRCTIKLPLDTFALKIIGLVTHPA